MSLINNIQNALNVKLASIGSLPTIYYPNTEKTPVQGTNYIRVSLLPANAALHQLDGKEMHQGIYQIDIFTQIKKGTAPLLLLADAVRDGFKTVTKLTSGTDVINLGAVSITQARVIESWWSCSVTVNYFCIN